MASSLGAVMVLEKTIMKPHSRSRKVHAQVYPAKILKQSKTGRYGHLKITIGVDGKEYSVGVHRLACLAFHGDCPPGMEACHDNGIGSDNRPSNLRWDTHANNNADRVRHGTYRLGEKHHMAKLTEEQALAIRNGSAHYTEDAKTYSINESHAHAIKSGRAWRHLANAT